MKQAADAHTQAWSEERMVNKDECLADYKGKRLQNEDGLLYDEDNASKTKASIEQ